MYYIKTPAPSFYTFDLTKRTARKGGNFIRFYLPILWSRTETAVTWCRVITVLQTVYNRGVNYRFVLVARRYFTSIVRWTHYCVLQSITLPASKTVTVGLNLDPRFSWASIVSSVNYYYTLKKLFDKWLKKLENRTKRYKRQTSIRWKFQVSTNRF